MEKNLESIFVNLFDKTREISGIGVWHVDLVNESVFWDDNTKRIHEVPLDYKPDLASGINFYKEGFSRDEIQRLCGEIIENGTPFNTELIVVTKSGKDVWVRAVARPQEENGKIIGFYGTFQDITKEVESQKRLEKHNEELQELSEKLQRSNEQLEEFAYVASHDLKTPIRNMSHYATFIEEDYGEHLDEEGIKMINGIKDQAQRMTNLVDDLLTYSRVNKMKLTATAAPMNSLIKEVVELLDLEAMPDVEVLVEDLGELKVDIIKMREVFNNLITNGIKYNDNELKKIKIWREGNLVYVKDNGIGIDESMKDKVFAFFKRLHAKDEYGGGTGAGMAIVQKVIDRHNATIEFKSKIGEGTTFILDFSKTN